LCTDSSYQEYYYDISGDDGGYCEGNADNILKYDENICFFGDATSSTLVVKGLQLSIFHYNDTKCTQFTVSKGKVRSISVYSSVYMPKGVIETFLEGVCSIRRHHAVRWTWKQEADVQTPSGTSSLQLPVETTLTVSAKHYLARDEENFVFPTNIIVGAGVIALIALAIVCRIG
jgi:hypothetical protein